MTSPVAKITDYDKRVSDDMLTQFYGDPVHEAIASAVALEYQRFENVAYDVLTKRLLDNSVGDILDTWGSLARVDRLGRTDDDYRRIILVAIAAYDSDGGAEQITWIATQLVGATVQYFQEGTANFTIQYDSDDTLSDELQEEAIRLIGIAVPAGVQWRLLASEAFKANQGHFDNDTFGQGRYGVRIGGS